ncbi:hypothetical protein C819_00626 [Lachnospiraceae bacterium 10-1]|nr:hypothetical protein C819_00626 [Lachnospiraceae bacterium 10-1]
MIRENEFPILEYSTEYEAVINPGKKDEAFPRLCIMTFFRDVFESFISKSVINYLDSCCIAEIFWWERIIMMTETGMQIREGQWI